MYHTATWVHQPYINSNVDLLVESLLHETGHRAWYYQWWKPMTDTKISAPECDIYKIKPISWSSQFIIKHKLAYRFGVDLMIVLINAVYMEESHQFFHICNRSKYYYYLLYIKITVLPADRPVCSMFTLHKTHRICKKTKGTVNMQKILGCRSWDLSILQWSASRV